MFPYNIYFSDSDYYKADKLFKPQLETLIKKHGGTVFWYVNQIPKSHRKLSYLITDTPSQTCNFLLALAYGVPCYHHRYIEQAISQVCYNYRSISNCCMCR